jgi:hypothetical protein
MIIKVNDRQKKTDILSFKQEPNSKPPPKHHLLQSDGFAASVRRHSVYGAPHAGSDYADPLSGRVSEKELKSLQKYKTNGKH